MSAVASLLQILFEDSSNSKGIIDSAIRWRTFCNKLNAAGVLCSENDRDTLAKLWTQHTTSRQIGNGNAALADGGPRLTFPQFRSLLEQLFAPNYRADIEQVLERADAVTRVWAANPSSVPADLTAAKRGELTECYHQLIGRIQNQRDTNTDALYVEDIGLTQLRAHFDRRPNSRKYQAARGRDIVQQLRIQQVPVSSMAKIFRGSGIRGAEPARLQRDVFGVLGRSPRPPSLRVAAGDGAKVVRVARGAVSDSRTSDEDVYQLVKVPLVDYEAFSAASNCYEAMSQLTFSAHALRCCGQSDQAVPGCTVFAYTYHDEVVRVSTVVERVRLIDCLHCHPERKVLTLCTVARVGWSLRNIRSRVPQTCWVNIAGDL